MFDNVEDAIQELKSGKPIIVVDDEDRENEGDLVAISEYLTAETINFMATHARGLICAPISSEIAQQFGLKLMTETGDKYKTAFTVSIDHASSTTGISAFERTDTIKALINETSPTAFVQPGHVFPLIAKDNGVLERIGHTEACVDLAKLSGAKPAGAICEIMNDDGTMARRDDLYQFKRKHGLLMITIDELVKYRKRHDQIIQLESKVKLPTSYGEFDMYGFTSQLDDKEYIVISSGEIINGMNIRIHSECVTGDIFHSARCDCGEQLEYSMKYIQEHGGMILYLPQEGRGIGLINKLKAYELIEQGYDTITANEALGFEADLRDYTEASQILKYFNIEEIQLISNNPDKFNQLQDLGIHVSNRVPVVIEPNETNESYINTKKHEMGHLI
ncbi:3,4-dihydroxy-2-butanone-4-phosphate synthase [Mammaliicoccus sciuri]|uniref:3,4-dihydroxy-2-butanone-4-phosphate synthase n=1 Tax=Mammaliicoccus sciuri TaxID=1296 RepID=UPI0013E9245D|nr:3,4-dihydroxy-2-butanone-4-phosphate synthase [Mammaliicoccus sciuri]MCD3219779.1 3,4-dihydroxy-2-butanone-4-phosphate synthase [Mammaliicoccus sciuri]MCJ0922941.1 3,4-dihydroxy-2-butanone-4-phosphate synthase [Mammaliicoccus sciuri]MCJ0924917.1 3,4-dihydroxy-2-butanone-4-phosphate synthase [Mammaliicoccus sciuri]MCJ1762124.1 3,4-dihydroxy-2-butanone-4-phosphate synthase [Mammaliicoccus sciuri]MEB6119502.1 3,4-dihydroxy-2-butanone-4-phosphate synthase [Mammaliicoccus sciuri]